MLKTAFISLLASQLIATAAIPCGFHNYTPQPTLTDRLLGSSEIVLARSAADNPFRFEVSEALEGALVSSEIPFLVDSATRRRLALDPNAAVLFARDGAYGPWNRIAFVDTAMAPVLDTVMERLQLWEFGNDLDRYRYFATLVGHPNDAIHKLALRELDQAEYSTLRTLQLDVDPARLMARLDYMYETEFKAIRILLLGLSGAEIYRDRLEAGLKASIAAETSYIGAYSTALIELLGQEVVTQITGEYLTDRSYSLFTRELLIEAIALHGQTDDQAMETTISEAVEGALWVDPSLAGAVARQFGSRGNWSHQSALEALLKDGAVHPPADMQDVSLYLTIAQEQGAKP